MNTREISHDQWVPFLDQFSEAHRGERVEVRILSLADGDQPQAAGIPLVGISDDPKAKDGEQIQIVAGEASGMISHAVAHPVHIRLAEQSDGKPVAMQIESEDGTATLVRFLTDTEGEC